MSSAAAIVYNSNQLLLQGLWWFFTAARSSHFLHSSPVSLSRTSGLFICKGRWSIVQSIEKLRCTEDAFCWRLARFQSGIWAMLWKVSFRGGLNDLITIHHQCVCHVVLVVRTSTIWCKLTTKTHFRCEGGLVFILCLFWGRRPLTCWRRWVWRLFVLILLSRFYFNHMP